MVHRWETTKNRHKRSFGTQNMTPRLITLEMGIMQPTSRTGGVPVQNREEPINTDNNDTNPRINTG